MERIVYVIPGVQARRYPELGNSQYNTDMVKLQGTFIKVKPTERCTEHGYRYECDTWLWRPEWVGEIDLQSLVELMPEKFVHVGLLVLRENEAGEKM